MNKALNNIILLSIFIVPMVSIIPMRGTVIWYPQLLALMCIGFICMAMIYWNTNKFISIFLIYTTFSYLFVCSQSPRSMLCLITGYSGIVFSYFVSQSETKNIYRALLILAIFNSILLILQIFNLDPIFKQDSSWLLDRTVGFMGSRNQLGIFSSVISIFLMCLSPWFILFALPIILVKCWSAFAGVMIGFISYTWLNGNKCLSLITIALCVISFPILIHSKSGELKERLEVAKLTISQAIHGTIDDYNYKEGSAILNGHRKIKFNPLFGIGIGNFFVYSPYSQIGFDFSPWHRYEHAHNDIVEAFLEFGYVGLGLIVLCFSKIVSDFIYCVNKTRGIIVTFSSLLCLIACSFGIYVFHAPVSLFLFCLTLGLFYGELRNAKQSQIT